MGNVILKLNKKFMLKQLKHYWDKAVTEYNSSKISPWPVTTPTKKIFSLIFTL